ncbi:MAG TPA: hypothetical protein VMM18_01780 [Gemmatimonadaceae bacterium]|nr:hypothetical protein [Gemmatimonadaceae bacterium]
MQRVPHSRLAVAAFVAVLLLPAAARAQTPGEVQVLTVPEGETLDCRTPPANPSRRVPAGVILREFVFGDPQTSERHVVVGYDDSGRALFLADLASQYWGGSQTVVADITSGGQVDGHRIDVVVDSSIATAARTAADTALLRSAVEPAKRRTLTPREQELVAALAERLRERRCARQ